MPDAVNVGLRTLPNSWCRGGPRTVPASRGLDGPSAPLLLECGHGTATGPGRSRAFRPQCRPRRLSDVKQALGSERLFGALPVIGQGARIVRPSWYEGS